MAFLNIKSASFLLIITIAFSSSSCVMAALSPSSISKAFQPGVRKINPALENIFPSGTIGTVKPVLPSLGEQQLKIIGEVMAEKVFGTAGRKGFSWGWNGSKFYLKAAKTCANYEKSLTSSCAQQVDQLRSLKPNCFKECVVEFAYTSQGTPKACTWRNDDSCKYNVITEKCIAGGRLIKNCTVTNW